MGGTQGIGGNHGVQKNNSGGIVGTIKEKVHEFKCIFTQDDKSCPDITAEYAARADRARNIEHSVWGGNVKNNYENAAGHRDLMEGKLPKEYGE